MDSTSIAEQLGQNGLCVCPHFLSQTSLSETRHDLDEIQSRGNFKRAGIGKNNDQNVLNQTRHDETYWLERHLCNTTQSLLWDKLDLLKQAFNRTLFLGLGDFEGHYATYPEGGFYKRHLDCAQQKSDRMVTVVIYLNHNWQESDGGKLRIYSESSFIDINPIGGTMVCFMSQESEHEVLESHATRYSFTGWFKNN